MLLAAMGCATVPRTPEGPSVESYYPLAVGNSWTYQGSFLGEKGTRTVRITERQSGFFKDDQGGELVVDAYGLRDRKRYLLRSPIARGTSWSNVTSISSVERYQIAEADLTDVVPAGRFEHCVRVVATNRLDDKTELVNELTYAPGVGLIRIHTAARIAGKGEVRQVSMELAAFEVGKERN